MIDTLISVESSNVARVGYDSDAHTLHVEFKNGNAYQYFDVPKTVYEGILNAGSIGQYLNQVIKGSYRYARV